MPKRQKIEVSGDEEAAPAPETETAEHTHEGEAIVEPLEQRVQRLEEQLAEAERRAQALHDQHLRALADLENLRRRARHERGTARHEGEAAMLLEILPLLDNFARALAAAQESTDARALMEGVKMSYDQLHAALQRRGVRPIEAEGKPFDPHYHDAVGAVPSADHAEGTVAVEIQKGYMLGDQVVRPSRVMVARRPPQEA